MSHLSLESRKKRERNLEEDDFYESDEDNFLDRTGTSKLGFHILRKLKMFSRLLDFNCSPTFSSSVEKKRLKRMRKAGKQKTEVDTYETLVRCESASITDLSHTVLSKLNLHSIGVKHRQLLNGWTFRENSLALTEVNICLFSS